MLGERTCMATLSCRCRSRICISHTLKRPIISPELGVQMHTPAAKWLNPLTLPCFCGVPQHRPLHMQRKCMLAWLQGRSRNCPSLFSISDLMRAEHFSKSLVTASLLLSPFCLTVIERNTVISAARCRLVLPSRHPLGFTSLYRTEPQPTIMPLPLWAQGPGADRLAGRVRPRPTRRDGHRQVPR